MYIVIKHLLDKVAAILFLIMLCPLLITVYFILLLSLGFPVIFTQERGGYKGAIFKIYKFRTMTNSRDKNGHLLPDVDRLTKVGRFVRRFSLDELPQLFNIIKGELSFIGPRALLATYLNRYSDEQKKRHHVRPGITGWAQVNGRNSLTWNEKFELDLYYVNHHSFFLDLKILLKTVREILFSSGQSKNETIIMEEFKGKMYDKN